MRTPEVARVFLKDIQEVRVVDWLRCCCDGGWGGASAVVDVHKDWCGPCKIMEPTYKRLAVDIDQSEKRVAFASVCSQAARHPALTQIVGV